MKLNLSRKVKGITNVSFAHLITLAVSLGTSFLLPLFLSVESYGYWQLFSLYVGYVGFFALGLNDGVHLNYASYDYNEETASKFKTFTKLLITMNLIEMAIAITMVVISIDSSSDMFWMWVLIALNVLPANVGGLYVYINQATMRFREYSRGLVIDKLIFFVAMVIMLLVGVKDCLMYILAYTISRYSVLVYHYMTSRLIFRSKGRKFRDMSAEIKHCFQSGCVLMIAVLLNGSLIAGSRFLVEAKFGIVEFSGYSFSIHTLVIASQVITSMAAVFYPIMKRCDQNGLRTAYDVFNKSTSILSLPLLFSYYFAAFTILLLYRNYIPVLRYYAFVYPLFIFQCKASVLITNMYKIMEKPWRMILNNAFGIMLNYAAAYAAYEMFGSITSIAIAVLVAYCIWYYVCQFAICVQMRWRFPVSSFCDLALTVIFILITQMGQVYVENVYLQLVVSAAAYLAFVGGFAFVKRILIRQILKETMEFLRD